MGWAEGGLREGEEESGFQLSGAIGPALARCSPLPATWWERTASPPGPSGHQIGLLQLSESVINDFTAMSLRIHLHSNRIALDHKGPEAAYVPGTVRGRH